MTVSELIGELSSYLAREGDHVVTAAEGVLHIAHPAGADSVQVPAQEDPTAPPAT